MKLLALDFDGVICEGLREIFLSGYNTYLHFHPDTSLLDGRLLTFEFYDEFDLSKKELFDRFVRLFPFGNKAESHYAILRMIEDGREVVTDEDFNRLKTEMDPKILQAYYEKFYEERTRLKEMDSDKWLKLNQIYPGMKKNLNTLHDCFYLVIATSKDKKSVLTILRANGLGDLFDEEDILDKEYGDTKDTQIKLFKEKFNLEDKDIYFVDDRLQVMVPVKNLGVNCYLATWGSNTKLQREQAKKQGIGLLALDDCARKLIAFSG